MRQMVRLTALSFQSLPQRLGPAAVAVVGIAVVVGVLVSMLSMGQGAQFWATKNAREDRAVVLSRGARSAATSALSREVLGAVSSSSGIERGEDGTALVSASAVVSVDAQRKQGRAGSIFVSGLTNRAVYPEIRVTEGRWFEPGVYELVVSGSTRRDYRGFEIGDRVRLRNISWTVAGVFDDPGGMFDQTVLGDAETIMSAFGQNVFQQITVRLESTARIVDLEQELLRSRNLRVEVRTERAYRDNSMKGLRSLLDFVSYFVSTLMAGGAICAAVNALYCSVDSRRREIATVRALGFAVHAIVASVVIEAMFLGACGAGLGSLASWLLFNGDVISTQGFTFPLRVDGHLVAVSVMWALLIGLIGAVLPSVRAASIPIVTGLRVS